MGCNGLSPPKDMIYLKSEVLLLSDLSVFLIFSVNALPQSTFSSVLYSILYSSLWDN